LSGEDVKGGWKELREVGGKGVKPGMEEW